MGWISWSPLLLVAALWIPPATPICYDQVKLIGHLIRACSINWSMFKGEVHLKNCWLWFNNIVCRICQHQHLYPAEPFLVPHTPCSWKLARWWGQDSVKQGGTKTNTLFIDVHDFEKDSVKQGITKNNTFTYWSSWLWKSTQSIIRCGLNGALCIISNVWTTSKLNTTRWGRCDILEPEKCLFFRKMTLKTLKSWRHGLTGSGGGSLLLCLVWAVCTIAQVNPLAVT